MATPTLLPTNIDPTKIVNDVLACIASGDLNSPECLKVLSTVQGLLALQEECKKAENQDTAVCQALNAAPLPSLPTAVEPTLGVPSITLPILPGLGRAPVGTLDTYGPRGPTLGQLMDRYDPALVSLMVPALVTRAETPARTSRRTSSTPPRTQGGDDR